MSECKHEVWTFPTQPVSVCEECERTSAELEYEKRISELEAALAVKEVTQLNYAPNYHRALKRVETLEAERDEWRDHANKLAADRIALESANKAHKTAVADFISVWEDDDCPDDEWEEGLERTRGVLIRLTKETTK